jgi:hypothetical protein
MAVERLWRCRSHGPEEKGWLTREKKNPDLFAQIGVLNGAWQRSQRRQRGFQRS